MEKSESSKDISGPFGSQYLGRSVSKVPAFHLVKVNVKCFHFLVSWSREGVLWKCSRDTGGAGNVGMGSVWAPA